MPPTEAAAIVAPNNPTTRRSSLSSNGAPLNRWISPPTMTGPHELATAKNIELPRLRSPIKLAARVAATTPVTTGNRTVGPNATRKPVATPAAGQNSAMPSDLSSSARLRRAAKKKTIATEAEMAHGGPAKSGRSSGRLFAAISELIACPLSKRKFDYIQIRILRQSTRGDHVPC